MRDKPIMRRLDEAFSQVNVGDSFALLAGLGELAVGQLAQLDKHGLDKASQMMRSVTGAWLKIALQRSVDYPRCQAFSNNRSTH
jgi:hypothetical protein